MTTEESDAIGDIRAELAALGRDMAWVQKELAEIRVIFSRLIWLVVVALMAGFINFALAGGLRLPAAG